MDFITRVHRAVTASMERRGAVVSGCAARWLPEPWGSGPVWAGRLPSRITGTARIAPEG
jgi:hypothetical protein